MIEWYDHYGNDDHNVWRTKGEIVERCEADVVIQTVGNVIHENRTRVIIVTNERVDSDLTAPIYQDYMVIYKKLIRTRQGL